MLYNNKNIDKGCSLRTRSGSNLPASDNFHRTLNNVEENFKRTQGVDNYDINRSMNPYLDSPSDSIIGKYVGVGKLDLQFSEGKYGKDYYSYRKDELFDQVSKFEIEKRSYEDKERIIEELNRLILNDKRAELQKDIEKKSVGSSLESFENMLDNLNIKHEDKIKHSVLAPIPNTPLFYAYSSLKKTLEIIQNYGSLRITNNNYKYGLKYYRPNPENGLSKDKFVNPKKYDDGTSHPYVAFSSTNSWSENGKNSINPKSFGWTYESSNRGFAYNEEDKSDEIEAKKSSVAFTRDTHPISPASLLGITDRLFQERKITTLVNRFYTKQNEDTDISIIQTAVNKKYGLSKGRNLLRKNPEIDESPDRVYDNPYCRVWTQLRQYSRFENAIRSEKYDESPYLSEDVENKSDSIKRLSRWSPLTETGRALIGPSNQDEIKKCMFSIENLAWKDIDGISHQKGPNGGRIMWFPPYNLKFNEQVTANWNGNKFIGRGEDIFTYTNSERNGTLSFTMLIDHPSCVNEWNKENTGTEIENDDILRFFAGCGDVKKVPIPENREQINVQFTNYGPRVPGPMKYTSLIFFPHHYSGETDWNSEDVKKKHRTPLDYLYSGKGYEFTGGDGYEMKKTSALSKDVEIADKGWYYRTESYITDEENIPIKKDLTSRCLNSDKNVLENKVITDLIGYRSEGFYVSFEELYELFAKGERETGSVAKKSLWKFLASNRTCKIRLKSFVPKIGNEKFCNDVADERVRMVERFFGVTGFPATPLYRMNEENKVDIKDSKIKASNDRIHYEKTTSIVDIDTENEKLIDTDESKLRDFVLVEFEIFRKPFVPISYGDYYMKQIDYFSNPIGRHVREANERLKLMKDSTKLEALLYNAYGPKPEEKEVEHGYMDNEYSYFRSLQKTDRVLYERLNEKIQYFNPAFHSITPEGFNRRLTFLQQCTRQGPTNSAPDIDKNTFQGYGNLAFGRPPYCVLRIGDFFNTKIIIDSISIDYGENQWDLNPEGIGIQPMMANISINFKFMGGADIAGPIEELQNAVSFNYYSNTSVYDKRSRIKGENVSVEGIEETENKGKTN